MPFELRQIGEPSPEVRISASNCAQSQTMWRGESHLIWHKTAPVAFNVEIDKWQRNATGSASSGVFQPNRVHPFGHRMAYRK
jgi:hypothetical protein